MEQIMCILLLESEKKAICGQKRELVEQQQIIFSVPGSMKIET
jgi:hypothetical protein